MSATRILTRLVERLGNPLEWPAVDKGILLCWVVVPLYLSYIAFAHTILRYQPDGALIDHQSARQLLYYLYGITLFSLLIGLAGLRWRRRNPDSLAYQHLAVQYYSITMTVLGYQVGSLSLVTGVVLAGAPLLGFIFFDRRAVLFGLASALLVIFATSFLSAAGVIDYAPVLVPERMGGENSLFWVSSMLTVFAVPHMVVLFSLSAYVIHRWHQREDEVKRLAIMDPLTGIPNRRWILAELDRELERARRTGNPLSVIMVDLDHFKEINDCHGHQIGDRALRAAAEALADSVRKVDRVGRYGGEEFMLILPDADRDAAMEVAERCRRRIAAATLPAECDAALTLTASLGVSSGHGSELSATDLIRDADRALYRAKEEGRNRSLAG